jgi:hypothetical protein
MTFDQILKFYFTGFKSDEDQRFLFSCRRSDRQSRRTGVTSPASSAWTGRPGDRPPAVLRAAGGCCGPATVWSQRFQGDTGAAVRPAACSIMKPAAKARWRRRRGVLCGTGETGSGGVPDTSGPQARRGTRLFFDGCAPSDAKLTGEVIDEIEGGNR